MKKIFFDIFIKYLSLTLVLSFFLMHNIYLVLFGIIISLYILNKNILKKEINFRIDFNQENEKQKPKKTKNISKKDIESENKLNDLSLVESIEEYGIIPSIKTNNDKAA